MHGFGNFDKTGKRGGGCELGQEAAEWSSPCAAEAVGRTQSDKALAQGWQETLCGQAELWPTPNTPDRGCETKESKAKRPDTGGIDLQTTVTLWPTPAGRDHKSGQASDETMEKNSRPLNEVASRSSLPAPPTSTRGKGSSKATRRLNPRFVEWLMGWPLGWTDCGCSETGLSRYKRRMRSCLFTLLSRMEGK